MDLQSPQFKTALTRYVEPGRGGKGYEEYNLYASHDPEAQRVGMMGIKHSPGSSWFSDRPSTWQEPERREAWETGKIPRRADYAEGTPSRDLMESYAAGKPKLFGEVHQQPSSTVESLFSNRAYRSSVPGMLGVAENYTQATRGRGLQPSTDLSKRSSKLSQHFQQKGLVGKGSFEPTNDLAENWLGDYEPSRRVFEKFEEVQPTDVSAQERQRGSRTVREMLHPRSPVTQGEQLRLF